MTASATCTAAPGQDSAQNVQTYEPAKAVDGAADTAWRCDGDASGQTLTVDFGTAVRLTSVSLIPGYAKIDPADGTDRFEQGRRVSRVRWTFADGSTVESAPNGERTPPATPVSTTTTTVRVTILATLPGRAVTNGAGVPQDAVDRTAISEVQFTAVR